MIRGQRRPDLVNFLSTLGPVSEVKQGRDTGPEVLLPDCGPKGGILQGTPSLRDGEGKRCGEFRGRRRVLLVRDSTALPWLLQPCVVFPYGMVSHVPLREGTLGTLKETKPNYAHRS